MTSLALPLILGLVAGCGVACLVRARSLRYVSLGVALDALDQPNWPVAEVEGQHWFTRVASAIALPTAASSSGASLMADLAVIGRSPEAHAVDKLKTALFWGGLPVVFGTITGPFGFGVGPVLLMIVSVGGFVGGWFLTDQQVRQRAAIRRREFRSTLVSYLQLVTILLAGGAGVNQALTQAAAYGQGWTFEVIQRSLRDSLTRNVTPWEGFSRVADELGLRHLFELAGAMRLAGESGAHVREGLLSKSESLRIHELAEIETEAAAASEKMGGPVGGMVFGFVVTMGYPAVVAILSI